MKHKGYDGDLDQDSQEGIVERATPRLEKILAKTHDDPNPPSIAKPGYHFDKNGKERKDRGPNKEVSKPKVVKAAKSASPYYINQPGVRFDVSELPGYNAFFDWLETNIQEINRALIVEAVETLIADVLKAKAKQ